MRPFLLALLLGTTSCARCGNGAIPTADALATAPEVGAAGARCVLVAHHAVGGLGGDLDAEAPVAFGAELGGVASDAQAFHVGLLSAGADGEAKVARVPHDGSAATLVTLPKVVGTRPPLVAVTGAGLLVGAMWRREGALSLELRAPRGSLGVLVQGVDDSEGTTLLATEKGTLVAWDDVEPSKAARGRVRLVSWKGPRATSDAGDAGDVDPIASSSTSDAHSPLLVASPDGTRAALLYLAERPEEIADHDGAAGEPSQDEAQRWVEVVLVDAASGAIVGAPRVLTPQSGHAQTMAAVWTESGLYVVVRDDPRPSDGDGGTLSALRVVIAATIEEPVRRVVADRDVAPGLSAVVPIPGGVLVSFLGQDGRARLVPQFVDGQASLEPVLDHRRIVAVRGSLVLATRLRGSALDLGLARCAW